MRQQVSIDMLSPILAVVMALTVQDSFDLKVSDPGLLVFSSVQRELKMTARQVSDVSQAEKRYKEQARQTKSSNSDEERKEVLQFLDGAQIKRLREISMQSAGPIVLLADIVAERVGADKAKQGEIHRAFDSVVSEITKPMQAEIAKMSIDLMRGMDGDPKAAEAKSREVDAKADQISDKYERKIQEAVQTKGPERIMATLTREQARTWTELLGRPFPVKNLKKDKRFDWGE